MKWLIKQVSGRRFEELPSIAQRWAGPFYWLLFNRRRIMFENLSCVFPEWDGEKKKKVSRKSLFYMLLAVLDTVWWYDWHSREKEKSRDWLLNECIKFSGVESKDLILERGGLVCTAHYGTFPGVAQFFAFHRPTGVFLKKIKNPYLQGWSDKIIREMGLVPLYVGEMKSVKKAAKILKEKGVLVVLLDQHFGRRGRIKVNFFNRPAFAAGGAVDLSLRMRRPVVAMFCSRGVGDITVIDKGVLWDRDDVSVQEIVQNFTTSLESVIMSNPEQWAWLHRRWKA